MDYRKEIQELRRTLTENGYLYYVLDAPTSFFIGFGR